MFRSHRARAAMSVMVLSLLASAGAARAQAPTVDDIVARNLKAKGGAEKLRSTTSVKISGKITAQGMDIPMISWAKRPNLIRREMEMQGQKMVTAFDGTTVWLVNPLAGSMEPQELTGPSAQMAKDDADFDSVLVDYKEKGHTVEFVGAETVDSKQMQHLKITKKNGQVQHYYIDPTTGLEARTVVAIEQGGTKAEVTTDLSNYQTVDGIMMPFTMRQSMNGALVAQVTIEKVEFNVPMDETLFKMPAKK